MEMIGYLCMISPLEDMSEEDHLGRYWIYLIMRKLNVQTRLDNESFS